MKLVFIDSLLVIGGVLCLEVSVGLKDSVMLCWLVKLDSVCLSGIVVGCSCVFFGVVVMNNGVVSRVRVSVLVVRKCGDWVMVDLVGMWGFCFCFVNV